MTAPTELQRASADLVQCLVSDRGLRRAAAFLRELAATLDRLAALRDDRGYGQPRYHPRPA